ncbi:MAG TPA: hypothetical protein VFS43_17670 [Polyangiaceae bacterium]|nr:hypothetical protein [Polyangiaceae bacterium]
MKCRGLPEEAAPLVAMVRYGRAVVERWVELARAPAELAAALGLGPVEPRGELANEGATRVAQGARRGRELSLSVRLEGARCVTVVSVGVAGGAPFARDRGPARASGEGEAPAYAQALAEGAPPVLARAVGEAGCVSLEFEGLAPEPEEVGRLVEAVFEATHGSGAYR